MDSFDETFDFVVVGSGGGSMCAGLVMRADGKSALVLEKTDLIGGTTARSGGVMWIPNNQFMKAGGIEDSTENAIRYLDATSGESEDAPGATVERRRTYVLEAPRMVDFLVNQGVKLRRIKSWPDYYDNRPGGSIPGRTVAAELFNANELGPWRRRLRANAMLVPAPYEELFALATAHRTLEGKIVALKVAFRTIIAKLTGKDWVTLGGALQGRMLQAALKAGVEVRTDSAVTSLIAEDGAVKGVVTAKDGRDWRIGARLGVLVNAGGFAHNQAMRDRYMPGTSAKWTATPGGDTGEMLDALMNIGAATAQMDEMVGYNMAIPPGGENEGDGVAIFATGGQMDIAKPHGLIVDQSGVRYMNEACSYMEFCQNMLKRNRDVLATPSLWILDQQFMKKYAFCGVLPGMPIPSEWRRTGFLKRAQTIEELARLCNIEPATLKATVERFNNHARAGADPDFHRGDRAYDNWLSDPLHSRSRSLGTIEQAPFYAAPVVPGDVGTYGGVLTDTSGRVLRDDGSPIAGLYATGVTTASVMGRTYPGAGCSIGPSFTWGYVAARHALSQSPPGLGSAAWAANS